MKVLNIVVRDNELRQMYEEAVLKHNDQNEYANSGFDLFLPEDYSLDPGAVKISYEVKAAMVDASGTPSAYCIYSRSSIYKMPLRMTNGVGVIDRGYRGNLCSVFDVSEHVELKRGQRLVQICAPDLSPFKVNFVESLEQTSRGEGGFGSTGV